MTPDFLPKLLSALRGSHLAYKESAVATYEQLRNLDFNSMRQAIVHNDVCTDNVLFDKLKLVVILDLEESGVNAALLDIASGI